MGILQKLGGQLWLQSGLGVGVATLSATRTLNGTSAQFQSLTASGADRNVVFPALGGNGAGQWFVVRNAGASNNIVCKKSDGSTTIATLAPGQWAIIVSGKVSNVLDWYVLADVVSLVSLTLTGTLTAVAGVFTGAVTTTDGVSSGTARKVGGTASVATAAGTVGPSTGTGETTLQSYAIPANTLKAGTVLRVVATMRCTAETGTTTFTGKLKLGSTALVTIGPFDLASGDYQRIELEIVSRAAPGASAAVVVTGTAIGLAAGAAVTNAVVLAPANYATNGALTLALTGQMSASDANAVASDQFVVEVIG